MKKKLKRRNEHNLCECKKTPLIHSFKSILGSNSFNKRISHYVRCYSITLFFCARDSQNNFQCRSLSKKMNWKNNIDIGCFVK